MAWAEVTAAFAEAAMPEGYAADSFGVGERAVLLAAFAAWSGKALEVVFLCKRKKTLGCVGGAFPGGTCEPLALRRMQCGVWRLQRVADKRRRSVAFLKLMKTLGCVGVAFLEGMLEPHGLRCLQRGVWSGQATAGCGFPQTQENSGLHGRRFSGWSGRIVRLAAFGVWGERATEGCDFLQMREDFRLHGRGISDGNA